MAWAPDAPCPDAPCSEVPCTQMPCPECFALTFALPPPGRPPTPQDLYVLRRAVNVYERLVRRFTAQTTDYQRLLSTFAEVRRKKKNSGALFGRGRRL